MISTKLSIDRRRGKDVGRLQQQGSIACVLTVEFPQRCSFDSKRTKPEKGKPLDGSPRSGFQTGDCSPTELQTRRWWAASDEEEKYVYAIAL